MSRETADPRGRRKVTEAMGGRSLAQPLPSCHVVEVGAELERKLGRLLPKLK